MEQPELDAAKSRAFDAIARMVGMTHYPANEILHGVRAEIDMTVQGYGQTDTAAPPPTEVQEPQGLCYVLSEAARKCEVYPVMSRTYQHSSNLAVPWERKRLAAETRVKELEADLATLRTGIKSVIKNCDRVVFAEEAYKKACADTKKCLQPLLDRTKSTASTENEAASLRTRLERAEEAHEDLCKQLRSMAAHYKGLPDRIASNNPLAKAAIIDFCKDIVESIGLLPFELSTAATLLPPSPGAVEAGGEEGGAS